MNCVIIYPEHSIFQLKFEEKIKELKKGFRANKNQRKFSKHSYLFVLLFAKIKCRESFEVFKIEIYLNYTECQN